MGRAYNLVVYLASKVLPLVGLVNKTVSDFLVVRKKQVYPPFMKAPVWIHCASLGEFEQGRPVIEAIKQHWPAQPIALTFFSKSGYEIRKNYPLADWIGYMPLDTSSAAGSFLNAIRPCIAIFVKYEFWYNHLDQLNQRHIPFVFISARLFKGHYLLKRWNRWLLKKVLNASAFFVQDDTSKNILNCLGYHQAVVTGDTRVDRVMDITRTAQPLDYFDKDEANPVFIAGSTWPADEFIINDFLKSLDGYRIIIVPHDPSPSRIKSLLILFDGYKPFIHSQWRGQSFRMMVVDSVGILNRLYAYARVAYIGGGFGKGIHNILEPAAYGIPVFFGPKYHSFKEATDLIDAGTAFPVQNAAELKSTWSEIIPVKIMDIKNKSSKYFIDNKGATAKIIDYLRGFIG